MTKLRVFGVGADVAHVPRFQRAFARHGDRFLRRAFHPNEIHEFHRKPSAARASFLASRCASLASFPSTSCCASLDSRFRLPCMRARSWAAKEAAFKAFQHYRVLFPEMCVMRQTNDDDERTLTAAASVFTVATQLPVAETPRALRLEFSGETARLAQQLGLVVRAFVSVHGM